MRSLALAAASAVTAALALALGSTRAIKRALRKTDAPHHALLQQATTLVCDCDGVLYVGGTTPTDGAPQAHNKLRAAGKPARFCERSGWALHWRVPEALPQRNLLLSWPLHWPSQANVVAKPGTEAQTAAKPPLSREPL